MSNLHPATQKTILLVDDEHNFRVATNLFLTHFGYVVDAVRNAEEALALFNPAIHDLVLTDNSMPGMTGAEMARVIKLRSPTTPVLMYSGNPPADQSCLDCVIQKPALLPALKNALDELLAVKPKNAVDQPPRAPHGRAVTAGVN
ncbi:MAG: response regulator [Verrucomicrobia bacterium]|nr:response regulator [Verrucomicrobiota bacterium]